MAEMNDFENIRKSFDYISEALDSMRAQNAMNAGNTDKVLTNINNHLDVITNEENMDLIKLTLSELKRNLDEKHNFVSSKFGEIEKSFGEIIEKSKNQLQAHEVKELFEIIASNLNTFSTDFSSQKELISQFSLKLEELKQDESQKKEILKNISPLKVELEKISNGFESIIIKLNANFKELSQTLIKLDSSEALDALKKDIENVFLSSNAILSTLQVIDRKNRELEEVITHLVTKEDFTLEREQVAKLILQNSELTEYVNNLPTQDNFKVLTEKVDTSVGIINALKNMLNETGKQNQKMLTAQLDNLEAKILNISTEEEFVGFRRELAEFAQQVIDSTNLMRTDLADTNADLKDLRAFLNSMEIKSTFSNFATLTKTTEENIIASVSKFSADVSEDIEKSRKLIKTDINAGTSEINEKINAAKQEITENSKLNLANVLEHIQSVVNNIFSVKNALHIENVENVEAIDAKFQDLKEEITTSSNFIAHHFKENKEDILVNVNQVSQEISEAKEDIGAKISQNSKSFVAIVDKLSEKIAEIKAELNQSSQENFTNILSIVEDFSNEISSLKTSIQETSSQNANEFKSLAEDLLEKSNSLKEVLTKDSEINTAELRSSIETLATKQNMLKASLVQEFGASSSEIKNSLANFSEKFANLEEILAQGTQINAAELKTLIENVSEKFNRFEEFLEQGSEEETIELKNSIENVSSNINNLKERLLKNSEINATEIKDLIDNLTQSVSFIRPSLEQTSNVGFSTIKSTIEALFQALNTLEENFDIKSQSNLARIIALFDDLSRDFSEHKEFLSESAKNNFEAISVYIQNLSQKIEETNANFSGDLKLSLSEMQSSISSLPQIINENQSVFENENKALLEESSKNIVDMSDKIQGLLKSFIARENPFKEDILYEFSELKSNLELIKEDLKNSNYELGGKIEDEINYNLKNLEAVIAEYNERYNSTLSDLQNNVSEGFAFVQQMARENYSKFDASIKETSNIKASIQSIIDNISTLNNDAAFADLSVEINKKFEGILLNVTQFEELSSTKNKESLQNILNLLEEKFENVSADLNSYQNHASNETAEFIQYLSEKVETIKAKIEFTGVNIIDSLSAKTNEVIDLFSPINQTLEKISEINFEGMIFDIKNKIDNSHFSITSAIKENIKNENEEQLQRISQDFENLSDKLNEIISKSLYRANEFSDLKNALGEIVQSIETNAITINDKLNNNDFLIEQFAVIKDSIYDVKIKSVESVSEALDVILEKLESFNFSEATENLISSKNEEIIELINNLQDKLFEIQDETKTELSDKMIQVQDELETAVLKELQENVDFIKEILTSLENTKSQNAESINTVFNTVHGKLETLNLSFGSVKSLISSENEALIEKIEIVEENLLQSQNEIKTNILNELQENMDSLKEEFKVSAESLTPEIIEKVLDDSRERVFDRFETLEDKIIDAQNITKTSILEELKENIDSIKENLNASEIGEEISGEITQKLEDLQEFLQSLSDEIDNKFSKSEANYKSSAQLLLGEVKTSFYEKVDDSLDDLKSFIEILENKKDVSEVISDLKFEINEKFTEISDDFEKNKNDFSEEIDDLKSKVFDKFLEINDNSTNNKQSLSVEIDNLKQEIFDKFLQISDGFESSISSISVKEDLDSLKSELETSVVALIEDLSSKISTIIEENKLNKDIFDKTEEISRRIEDLKNSVADDITEKLALFEINLEKQSKDFSELVEVTKGSLAELKENFVDLSLNSTMEISSLLVTMQEKIENLETKFDEFNLTEKVENIENKIESISFEEIIENIDSNFSKLDSSKEEIKNEFELINQKLDLFALDSSSDSEIKTEFELINQKLDLFTLNSASDTEIKENVEEIKQIVKSQNEFIKTLNKTSENNDIINSTRDEIKKMVGKFEEKLNLLALEDISGKDKSTEVKKELSTFKTELFENLVVFFNQISFVAEAEEIKDYVDEKTEEIKNYLKLFQKEAKEAKQTKEPQSDITGEYSYTLQDVESDIAKVRMVLNDIVKTSEGEGPKPKGDFAQLNENIMSISSRTNKLLLNSDESYSALRSNLDELRNVVYKFEEKVKYIDNKEQINRLEKKLENINNLMVSSVKSDQIFNQTFMYLAEWIDRADEKMANIEEKFSDIEDVKMSMLKSYDLDMVLDKFAKKFDKQQEKIKSLEEKIEKLTKKAPSKETDIRTIVNEVLDKVKIPEINTDEKLVKKMDGIDRRLTTLGKNIEKITSYVE